MIINKKCFCHIYQHNVKCDFDRHSDNIAGRRCHNVACDQNAQHTLTVIIVNICKWHFVSDDNGILRKFYVCGRPNMWWGMPFNVSLRVRPISVIYILLMENVASAHISHEFKLHQTQTVYILVRSSNKNSRPFFYIDTLLPNRMTYISRWNCITENNNNKNIHFYTTYVLYVYIYHEAVCPS